MQGNITAWRCCCFKDLLRHEVNCAIAASEAKADLPCAFQALNLGLGAVLGNNSRGNMQGSITAGHRCSLLVQGDRLLLDQPKGLICGVDAVVPSAAALSQWSVLTGFIHLPETHTL